MDARVSQLIITNRLIFEKAGIDPKDFLSDSFGEKSKECHKKILEYLCSVAPNGGKDLSDLEQANYQYLTERWFEDQKCVEDVDYQVAKVLHQYMGKMYGTFFDIKNGRATYTGIENFVLPSTTKPRSEYGSKYDMWKDDMGYIYTKLGRCDNDSELELIITHDGVTYLAPNTHIVLAGWLNVNGVDMHNAIRLEASKNRFNTSTFSFTSLFNYSFSKSSNEDRYMIVSGGQADILGRTYDALSSDWSNMQPMEEAMKYTTGFGVGLKDLDEEYMSANLATFNRNMESFDKGKYIADIRRNPDVHNPMK